MADEPVNLNDADDEYRRRLEAAKPPRVPVGGAPMPKIPPLTTATDRAAGVQAPQPQQKRLLTPEDMKRLQDEGQFIPGVGSAYPVNQPAARPGTGPGQMAPHESNTGPGQMAPPPGEKFANPPRPEGAGLRPETTQQLEELVKAQTKAEETTKAKEEPEDDQDDEFDFDEFGNRVRNLLANKKRREAIEARCPALRFEDLIMIQELRQKVPIVPGQFEPMFRTTSGEEDLFIKRQMMGDHPNTQYVLTRYALMSLAAGLYAINGQVLPSHMNSDGSVDEKLWEAKFKLIKRYPVPVLADLGVNYKWFDNRVRKLLVVDEIRAF